MYLRKKKPAVRQSMIEIKLNEKMIAYSSCTDMYLNLQFTNSNDASVSNHIDRVINLNGEESNYVLNTEKHTNIDLIFRITPTHSKLTWFCMYVQRRLLGFGFVDFCRGGG